jgi:hypothetical protein
MITLDWKNATTEQINLWKYASGLIAYTTITPLYYDGTIAGSEFLIYNVGKLYVALNLKAMNAGVANINFPYIQTFNNLNALKDSFNNTMILYNSVSSVEEYMGNMIDVDNIYFSRIVSGNYIYMCFNGYRLNV